MNILTLNTLNSDKIIVRGNGGNTGGGGSLEGEYFLDRPNNYWKVAAELPETLTSNDDGYLAYSTLATYFGAFGAAYEAISYNGSRIGLKIACGRLYEHSTRVSSDAIVRAPLIAAIDGKIDAKSIEGLEVPLVFNSLIDLLLWFTEMQGMVMTEDEIVAMLAADGVQRITKEEYESLITA
jgi:hypothetical protein